MKRAVSVSIGSSKRDKSIEIELLGERILIERIGTDGDMQRATELFNSLDGQVDALGVGGADLGLDVDGQWYPLHSVAGLVAGVKKTPVVDGAGLKNTLEARLAAFLDAELPSPVVPRRALITSGADRWGMTISFSQAGYECVFGDLMFSVGLPIPLRSTTSLKRLARWLVPIFGRLPFAWLYPVGEAQDERTPKWESYYQWAKVIAGDCHYIKRHLPDRLPGKIVVTNTTTPADVALFRETGIRYLVTSTPVLDGRSFGTNMMEAALVALAGKGRPLTREELAALIDQLGLTPQLHDLGQDNPAEASRA
ncbi:MAG TPA: hypothetical protein VGA52_08070 [Anaerolineales bacterium]|jgi:hypothetical protein